MLILHAIIEQIYELLPPPPQEKPKKHMDSSLLKNSDLPNEKTIILDLPYVLEHKYGQIFAVVKIMRSWAKNYFHNWDTTILL